LKTIELDPENLLTLTQLGVLYFEQDDIDSAEDCLKRAIIISKKFAPALVQMGNLLFHVERLDLGLCHHKKAIKHILRNKKNELERNITFGKYHLDNMQLEDAVRCFKLALQIDNNLPLIQGYLATALLKQGNAQNAMAHFSTAIYLSQTPNTDHYFGLGQAYYDTSDFYKAI
jgi:tetratricopeptide (TPR) repeat protein